MSDIPEDLYYTQYHQWVRIDENEETITVGLTDVTFALLGHRKYGEKKCH